MPKEQVQLPLPPECDPANAGKCNLAPSVSLNIGAPVEEGLNSPDCAAVPTSLAVIAAAFKGLEWIRRRKNKIAQDGKVQYTQE